MSTHHLHKHFKCSVEPCGVKLSGSGNPYYLHGKHGLVWKMGFAVQDILIFLFLPVCVYTVKIFLGWAFASSSICYWDCLVWVLLPKCVYHFRMQDLEKSVVLPALKFLMAEETNLVLPCFDTMVGSCFWAAFFLPCDKSHQFFMLVFFF